MRAGAALRSLAACVAMLALSGCTAPMPSCLLESQRPMLLIDLYFGRDIVGRAPVTDAEWAAFAAHEITPRFPDGFTVMDAQGQWLNPAMHRIGREATKLVRVAVLPGRDIAARVGAIVAAYRGQFQQEAVGVTSHEACGAF
jgi:hypothetical protein